MNAMLCDQARDQLTSIAPLWDNFSRVGVRTAQERRCPHCDSIIYSRRHKLCGVCAQELPEVCRFDATQAENVRNLLREEKLRHRVWMSRYAFGD